MSRRANRFTMDEVRAFWDGVAAGYERENELVGWVHAQRFREAMKRFACRPGMRVLNIWSRTGGAIPYLRASCADARLVNAELSLAMLATARRRYPAEAFVQTSLDALPFAPASFDAAVSLETLEHVPDPMLFLREVRRVIVSGGLLVMSLPPDTAEWTGMLNRLFGFHHGEGPHRFIAPGVVKTMLAESGFELAEHRGTLFLPLKSAFFEKADARLSGLLGGGPLARFGLRQFYVCTASR